MLYCTQCGAQLPDHAQFCLMCGAKLLKAPAAAESEPDPAKESPKEPAKAQDEIFLEECVRVGRIVHFFRNDYVQATFGTFQERVTFDDVTDITFRPETSYSRGKMVIVKGKKEYKLVTASHNSTERQYVNHQMYRVYLILRHNLFGDPMDEAYLAPPEKPQKLIRKEKAAREPAPAPEPKPLSKRQRVKQRIKENEQNGIACCPKCGSTSLSANKKGFGVGKALIGAELIGGLGLMAGNLGAKKVQVTCLHCGHRWTV